MDLTSTLALVSHRAGILIATPFRSPKQRRKRAEVANQILAGPWPMSAVGLQLVYLNSTATEGYVRGNLQEP